MGPDPDDYNHGHFPLSAGLPPIQEDVLMSDAESPSPQHSYVYYHHNHHHQAPQPYPQVQSPYLLHFFAPSSAPALASTSSAATGSYAALSSSNFASSGSSTPSYPGFASYSLASLEHDLANLNDDEGAPMNAIQLALDALSPIGTMTSSSYTSFSSPDEHGPQGELDATTPSAFLAQFPHHEPLPQATVPVPQPISFEAGSWPTTVHVPGPVLPSLPPLVQSVNPPGEVSFQLQQLQNFQNSQDHDSDDENASEDDGQPQPAAPATAPVHVLGLNLSHPNPNSLGPENPQLFLFLQRWIWDPRARPAPDLDEVNAQASHPERVVHYNDLEGDCCDIQGLDWLRMGTTRRKARTQRMATYKNYVNRHLSDVWKPHYELPNSSNFFRFRRMNIKRNVHLAHFQLRNVLSCVSRSLAFYPVMRGIHQINPVSGKNTPALDLKDIPSIQVSTLSARHGTLVAGGFTGDYYIKSLDSIQDQEPGHHEGQLTANMSGITNHVQIYQDRKSDSPLASFASNDAGFRTLDLTSQTVISEKMFDFPINCTAISPDKRLRVMVGDHNDVLICNSETNEILQQLRSHKDFGFACDWSEDGWSVATGFQDMMIKIWDARRWTDSNGKACPVTTIKANMAGVRSLRYSPLGSGKPVLVAAEEADFINLIDAETFSSRQTVDIFGEIGGVDFANDGRELMALCCDRDRGGLIRFERTSPTIADLYDSDSEETMFERDFRRGVSRRSRTKYSRRRYQASCLADLDLY